jgi:hypothetical protein
VTTLAVAMYLLGVVTLLVTISLNVRHWNRTHSEKLPQKKVLLAAPLISALWPVMAVAVLGAALTCMFPGGKRLVSRILGFPSEVLFSSGGMGLPPGPQWWQRVAPRLAHYEPLIVLIAFAGLAVSTVTKSPIAQVGNVVILALLIVTVFAEAHHEWRLCARCAVNTPLDGSAEATRRRRWLRFYHWSHRRPWYLMLWIVALAVSITLHSPNYPFYPLYFLWAAMSLGGLKHRPVEPWCPQCHWKDGGDEEEVPVPPPVPTGRGVT